MHTGKISCWQIAHFHFYFLSRVIASAWTPFKQHCGFSYHQRREEKKMSIIIIGGCCLIALRDHSINQKLVFSNGFWVIAKLLFYIRFQCDWSAIDSNRLANVNLLASNWRVFCKSLLALSLSFYFHWQTFTIHP